MDHKPLNVVTARPLRVRITTARRVARARSAWRETARTVALRWDVFLGADSETRAFAYRSYLAALDAEERAAARIAELMSLPLAARGVTQ
jgi:hypothetical protein